MAPVDGGTADCATGYGGSGGRSQEQQQEEQQQQQQDPSVAVRSSDTVGIILHHNNTASESESLPVKTTAGLGGLDSRNASPAASPTASSGRSPLSAGRRKGGGRCAPLKAWMLRVGPSCCSDLEIQKHYKLIMVAIFFCVFGTALCTAGLLIIIPEPHPLFSILFIVGGVIIFVPGIYHVVYVMRAYHGHDGYTFDNLPSMD